MANSPAQHRSAAESVATLTSKAVLIIEELITVVEQMAAMLREDVHDDG